MNKNFVISLLAFAFGCLVLYVVLVAALSASASNVPATGQAVQVTAPAQELQPAAKAQELQ